MAGFGTVLCSPTVRAGLLGSRVPADDMGGGCTSCFLCSKLQHGARDSGKQGGDHRLIGTLAVSNLPQLLLVQENQAGLTLHWVLCFPPGLLMPDYIGGQNAGCGGYLVPGTLDGTTGSKDRNSAYSWLIVSRAGPC